MREEIDRLLKRLYVHECMESLLVSTCVYLCLLVSCLIVRGQGGDACVGERSGAVEVYVV